MTWLLQAPVLRCATWTLLPLEYQRFLLVPAAVRDDDEELLVRLKLVCGEHRYDLGLPVPGEGFIVHHEWLSSNGSRPDRDVALVRVGGWESGSGAVWGAAQHRVRDGRGTSRFSSVFVCGATWGGLGAMHVHACFPLAPRYWSGGGVQSCTCCSGVVQRRPGPPLSFERGLCMPPCLFAACCRSVYRARQVRCVCMAHLEPPGGGVPAPTHIMHAGFN